MCNPKNLLIQFVYSIRKSNPVKSVYPIYTSNVRGVGGHMPSMPVCGVRIEWAGRHVLRHGAIHDRWNQIYGRRGSEQAFLVRGERVFDVLGIN